MKAKWKMLFVLMLPVVAYAVPSLEETWPLCKGWSYKIEPYLAYRSDELTFTQAEDSLAWLGAHRGRNTGEDSMIESDHILRIQGYLLRMQAEQEDAATVYGRKRIDTFCGWIATHHAPE